MSVREPRRSNADGLSENVLKAILEPKAERRPPQPPPPPPPASLPAIDNENEEERRESTNTDNRGARTASFLDSTSLSTMSSKRSLHSSRLTLSDSREFYKTIGCRWIRAVRLGDAKTVKKMLEEKPELVHYAPLYGPMAIHVATARADRSILKLLVAKGADVDARDAAGYTSLHLAIRRANQSLAHFLISQGASVELLDPDGLHITEYEQWSETDQEAAENFVYGKPIFRPKAHSFVGSPSSTSLKSANSNRPVRPSSTPDNSFCSHEKEKSASDLKREGTRSSWKSFFEKNPLKKKFGSGSGKQ